MIGKGSTRRPCNENQYRDNYDKVFGKKARSSKFVETDEELSKVDANTLAHLTKK